MAIKRITISLEEDKFEDLKQVIPPKVNMSEIIGDLLGMFIGAHRKYGNEFILDFMYNKGGFSIQRNETK